MPFSNRSNFTPGTLKFFFFFFWAGPAQGAIFHSSALSKPCSPLPHAMLLVWFISTAFTSRVLMKTLNSNEVLKSHCDFKWRVLTKKADLVKLQEALTHRWSALTVSIKCTPVLWLPLLLAISSVLPRNRSQANLWGLPVCHVCRFEMFVPSRCCLFRALSCQETEREFFLTLNLFPPRQGADGFMGHLVPFCIILKNATFAAQVARN